MKEKSVKTTKIRKKMSNALPPLAHYLYMQLYAGLSTKCIAKCVVVVMNLTIVIATLQYVN